MLFNTLSFAVFMTVVFLVYWILPHRFRWIVLLVANTYFYLSFDVKYLVILLFTAVASYGVGIAMENQNVQKKKKILLSAGIASVLVFLFVFKYLNFAIASVETILKAFAIPVQETTLKLLMPAGISFYSFQMVGYLVDVYRGKIKAEHHFGKYAIFVSFFPNISSGPIERAGHFIPQIDAEKKFDYDGVVYGSRMLLWGMFKKAVFADKLAQYADIVFNNVYEFSGLSFVLATFFYTFQIYCDFSAYSDMAIGIAKMLGFDLSVNFRSPYFATSITDFWSRWHISLSTWFRDYVYIPLGGNRVSKFRRNLNLLITFLVSGLWHGANWTFVLWGGIHGVCQVIEKTVKEIILAHGNKNEQGADGVNERTKELLTNSSRVWQLVKTIFSTVVTFYIVSYAWMFFRADSIAEALYMAQNMFTDLSLSNALMQMAMGYGTVLKILIAIVFIMVFDYVNQKKDVLKWMGKLPAVIRWGIYVGAAIVIITLNLHGGVSQQFIYFNF